jgi:serine-type D-Ala-D-Ala carboxypeptidase/endopeptidase (penicillin-binding protein 4)
MKKLFFILFCSGLVLSALPAFSQKSKISKLQQILDKSGLNKSDLSLYVSSGSEVWLDLNSDTQRIPASITKLVTAAATLKTFPPGTKFTTQLLSTAPVKKENQKTVLKGDLYLKGGGDPGFVSETMWFLVNNFIRTGITEIEGDIIVDDSRFDRSRFDDSRESIRVERAYDSPTGAMSFNWNSINVFVRPRINVGEPAAVFVDPENDYIDLKSSVKTVSANGKTALEVNRDSNKNGETVKVSGTIAVGASEQVIYRNITQPDLWSGSNLKSFLEQRGVKLKGKIKTGIAPDKAQQLAKSESKPIEHILADMNKFSNNYVAEMLTKNIDVQKQFENGGNSKPGRIAGGIEVMKKYLLGLGLKDTDFVLVNPSGLTRENRFSAIGLWKVLSDMNNSFQYQSEFIASLPIAGIDGTLKKRMKETSAERWVRAKTGMLNDVVSLAGFVGRKDGHAIPFVFIYNGKADEAKVRLLFDQLCIALVESATP